MLPDAFIKCDLGCNKKKPHLINVLAGFVLSQQYDPPEYTFKRQCILRRKYSFFMQFGYTLMNNVSFFFWHKNIL